MSSSSNTQPLSTTQSEKRTPAETRVRVQELRSELIETQGEMGALQTQLQDLQSTFLRDAQTLMQQLQQLQTIQNSEQNSIQQEQEQEQTQEQAQEQNMLEDNTIHTNP